MCARAGRTIRPLDTEGSQLRAVVLGDTEAEGYPRTPRQLSGWAAVLATVPSSASPYGAENDGTKDGERRDPQGERE